MERYFLGIDGGGTKTKVSIIDEKQTNLYMGIGGPSSIDTVNAKQTLQSIRDALADVTEKLGFFPMFSAVYVGLGGIVTETDCHITEKLLRDLPGVTKETKITARNDMENALASGLCFKEGITLIAGTGMVAYGKDKQGNFQKCGGWGYKEGDAGSAYFLGYEALKAAVYATDGRLPATKFTDEVCEVTDMKNMYYIVSVVEKYYADRTLMASLAPLVTKHADNHDVNALHIVHRATQELALAVRGVHRKLKLEDKTLVIVGSVGNSEGMFKKFLTEKLLEIDDAFKIIQPKIDPAVAAAILAKMSLN